MMELNQEHHSGFQFDNFSRNEKLISLGIKMPRFQSTGTTIAGIVYKDGVILSADTRATSGNIVADKFSKKIHYMQPNMYCCGAGTAADLEMTCQMMSSQLELHRLHTGRQVPIVAANRMLKQYLFRYQGYVGAALILGGVDKYGFHVYTIHPHGSSEKLPYTTMGSGSLAAMSVLESRWKPDMELEDAKRLLRDAITSGITNDMGSGSNVDLCVITKDGATLHLPYECAEVKGQRLGKYGYPEGTTEILQEIVKENVTVTPDDPSTSTRDDDLMDTA